MPVIRAFMLDERKAEETMREIRQRSPSNVGFAEAKLRPDLQWHYLRSVPPHSLVEAEACGGVVKRIEGIGPCAPEKLRVLAINGTFGGGRLRSLSLFDGASELSLEGFKAEMLSGLQAALDERDPDALALFDADHTQFPALGARARANGLSLRLGRVPWATELHARPPGEG